MLDKQLVFEIHRLKNAGLSVHGIADRLNLARRTVAKYLIHPDHALTPHRRGSKLDEFADVIAEFIKDAPDVKAPVVLQRLSALGYRGQISLVREYLRQRRGSRKQRQAFIRFESAPGEQMQIDWGEFGVLTYGQTHRKVYGLIVTECYSRMCFLGFTHSQKQPLLHQMLLDAFQFFGGTPEKLVFDNMLTAVTERQGSLVRFNEAFLEFLRPLKIEPFACNVRAPYEKGKIERLVGYVKTNFWPLRNFKNLADVQSQADHWRDATANARIHQTTGAKPAARFEKVKLRPLPDAWPDCRESHTTTVRKDMGLTFDGNTYTAPHWCVGRAVTLKASLNTVAIYYKELQIAVHERSYNRYQRIEKPEHLERLKKLKRRQWQDRDVAEIAGIGQEAREYLDRLGRSGLPIKKTISKLLALKAEYGASVLIEAIRKALNYNALNVEAIENILRQNYAPLRPISQYPPVKVKDEALNRIRLSAPMLADYDAIILKKRSKIEDD